MPRIARVVIPGMPHHVTHRENRRADVFFCDQDRQRYLAMLGEYARQYGLSIWAYCLMTNHEKPGRLLFKDRNPRLWRIVWAVAAVLGNVAYLGFAMRLQGDLSAILLPCLLILVVLNFAAITMAFSRPRSRF